MIKYIFLFFQIMLICSAQVLAQGVVKGKITDEKGEAVIGATISLESNSNYGEYSDVNGEFELKVPSGSSQTIIITYVGYIDLKEKVNLKPNQVLVKNFSMTLSSTEISTVVVSGKANLSNDMSLEKMKMKSIANIDYISAATIGKTGDASVVSAVSRISGVSTNGGFITVRGIGDRYIKTTVNGSRIPTLDPFTNNIKLDMFPTSLINNVVITKTASPDLPGDWAGAFLSIETKDFPSKLTIQYESSFGYNNQSTGKEALTSNTSKTDWFGYDNGMREYDHNSFVATNDNITKLQEYEVLGLGDYYASLGITEQTQWTETYTKLGLVELGLLNKADFNNNSAVNKAMTEYNQTYKKQAFEKINKQSIESAKKFQENSWNPIYKRAPIDYSQTINIVNQINIKGKPLGFLFAFRNYGSMKYDSNSVTNKVGVNADGDYFISQTQQQKSTIQNNGWSSLMIVAYRPNRYSKISFLIMPNINGSNKIRNGVDENSSQTYKYVHRDNIFYEERKQMLYQLKSSYNIPDKNIEIKYKASYTQGTSNAPDFKYFKYFSQADKKYIIDTKESSTYRYYRYLNEDIFDTQIEGEMPLTKKKDLPRKLKLGGSYQLNTRNSNQYAYNISYNQSTIQVANNDFNSFFADNQFDIITNETGFSSVDKYYENTENPANQTIGNNKIYAGFTMIDYAVTSNFLFSGGIRLEYATIFTDAKKYDELGLSKDDSRRKLASDVFFIEPALLEKLNYLPSVNVIYKLKEDIFVPTNLRVNYSQTLARPSIREMSDVVMFDYELQENVFGNSNLKTVQINNYDFRIESTFKNNANASISIFYKDFKNHIELIRTGLGFTWENVGKSTVQGIELEAKKIFFDALECKTNITLVKSNTNYVQNELQVNNGIKSYIPRDTISRSMYGQAPYVINAMVSYTADSIDLNITLSYNLQGEKLVITSSNGAPNIYEMPRNQVDLKISKKLGDHFSSSFKVQDILNSPIRRTYKYEEGFIVDYDKYQYGTSYSLSISYKF